MEIPQVGKRRSEVTAKRLWPCEVENEGKYCADDQEADLWAATGVQGRKDDWVDTAHVVWSEVISSVDFGMAVAIQAFTEALGWSLFTKMRAGDGSEIPGC